MCPEMDIARIWNAENRSVVQEAFETNQPLIVVIEGQPQTEPATDRLKRTGQNTKAVTNSPKQVSQSRYAQPQTDKHCTQTRSL